MSNSTVARGCTRPATSCRQSMLWLWSRHTCHCTVAYIAHQEASSRNNCQMTHVAADCLLTVTPCPCFSGALELMASQTTSSLAASAASVFKGPDSCAYTTKGQPGLNHSSTTVLPRKSDSFIALPFKSGSEKSTAGCPTWASVAIAEEETIRERVSASVFMSGTYRFLFRPPSLFEKPWVFF